MLSRYSDRVRRDRVRGRVDPDHNLALCRTTSPHGVVIISANTIPSPGGGACETALSLHLEDYGRTLETKEQLAVTEFADALMVIPTTLTCNAALDAIDLTSKLRVAHHAARTDAMKRGQKYFGLDLINSGVQDCLANGVVEPTISKLKSLKFATEAAITILRIDDLIKLEPEQQQQGR